jgi:hypothetical protein
VYLVDDTAGDAYTLGTELGPDVNYQAEFAKLWGFPFAGGASRNWTKDVLEIYLHLNVVDNWDEALYETVKASNGALGAGGGAPRQPWAPAFSTGDGSSSSRSHSASFLLSFITALNINTWW